MVLDLVVGSSRQQLGDLRPTIPQLPPSLGHDAFLLGAPGVLLDGRVCGENVDRVNGKGGGGQMYVVGGVARSGFWKGKQIQSKNEPPRKRDGTLCSMCAGFVIPYSNGILHNNGHVCLYVSRKTPKSSSFVLDTLCGARKENEDCFGCAREQQNRPACNPIQPTPTLGRSICTT